jgi:hypothetical protein
MNKSQLLEMKTHPAEAAKKGDPITRIRSLQPEGSLDLTKYRELRGGVGNDPAGWKK